MPQAPDPSAQVERFAPGPALDANADAIWEVLQATDMDFLPSLASRNGTTTRRLREEIAWAGPVIYFEDIMKQHVAIATSSNRPVGLVSYIRSHVDELLNEWSPSTYITTIAVRNTERGHGFARLLLRSVLDDPDIRDGWLSTRTWSTNRASLTLFTHAGFQEVHRIPDHRKAGVDTVYLARER